MDLYIYTAAMEPLGVIDEIKALVWTRRYWDTGEFALLLPQTARHAALIQPGNIITRKDADEAGQIRYLNISKDADGLEQIEAKGLFLTHWIGKRLLLAPLRVKEPTHKILERIVRENLTAPADPRRKIQGVALAEADLPDVAAVTCDAEAHENALDVCVARAKLARIGFKINTDLHTRSHRFTAYKGLDRTSGQTQNPACVFSLEFDTILTQEYVHSVENVASAVFVGGESQQDVPRMVVEVSDDERTGLDRVEVFYDATDIRRAPSGGEPSGEPPVPPVEGEESPDPAPPPMTDEEYAALLSARGERTLAGKIPHVAFSSIISPHAHLCYRRDFDVGDRVTCVNKRWGIRIDARITEVAESYESGREDIEITFGESIPTLSDAFRRR